MGQYLASVANATDAQLERSCPLLGIPLPKIRELHGGYKSICDTFAINITEFESIFSSNKATFSMFDTEGNGLIDALELFSGIIVFSAQSSTEEKIRFLFDLYDFNEIQSISLMDLEFMIQNTLISTSKAFNLGQDISDAEIAQLVRLTFQEGARISLPQFHDWLCKTSEVEKYCLKFKIDPPAFKSEVVEQIGPKFTMGAPPERRFPPQAFEEAEGGVATVKAGGKQMCHLVANKRYLNFRAWLHTSLQPLLSYRHEQITLNNYLKPMDEIKMRLEWVYGIRCQDTKRPLQYAVGKQYADSTGTRNKYEKKMQDYSEELIYFVGPTVVLLNIKNNKQRFYTQHHQEIISLAISNMNGDIVATGEQASLRPRVHIWNSRTLDNINVLQGIHQKGVHLLAFSSDDKYLITCGMQDPSPVLIYDWSTGIVVVSASIMSSTIDIIVLHGQRPRAQDANEQLIPSSSIASIIPPAPTLADGFALMSLTSLIIFVFDPKSQEYKQSQLLMEQAKHCTTSIATCCISILADYKNQYFKQGGSLDILARQGNVDPNDAAVLDTEHALKHVVLTGHQDGKVLIWRLQTLIGVLDDYQSEVSAMSKCYEGLAIATQNGKIYIWDDCLLKCGKIIDINTLPFKILSSYIVNLDYNQKRLLVLTMNGDVIEIALNDAGASKSIRAQRINTMVRITGRKNKAMAILSQSEQTVMIGGDNGIVSSFDIATHELIDIWNVGQPIYSIACLSLDEGGFVVAAGTEQGKIVIKQDWEEFIPRMHECGNQPIIDIQFSKNGQLIVSASEDKSIYLLKFTEQEYIAMAACKLDNGFPVAVNFSDDSTKVLIVTNQRKMLVMDPSNFEIYYKPEDLSCQFWSTYTSRFTLLTKTPNTIMMPIILGNQSNIVAAGDENGNFVLWKDVDSIQDNIGPNCNCHTTDITRIEMTYDDKRILTLGNLDQTVCQFKIKPLRFEESEVNTKRGVNEISASQGVQKIVLHPELDETLILELNYCWQIQTRKTDNVHDQTVLVRGSNNPTVNRIMGREKFDMRERTWIRPPSISLDLEHVYGVLVSDKRHTIMYMHFFNKTDQDLVDQTKMKFLVNATQTPNLGETLNKNLDTFLPRVYGNDYQNLLKQNQPVQYDPSHAVCEKKLIYFVSRFGILYDTVKKTQQFYQSHKLKISALAKHPYLRIAATGEVNINPQIHVWDALSMETMCVLHTSHSGGVLHLVFSQDGQKLISIGMDRTFSIQVFIWRQARSIAFRNTGFFPIFGVKFNPFDDNQFYTCGYHHFAEWKINGTHLDCVKYINALGDGAEYNPEHMNLEEKDIASGMTPQKNILLCLDFISYRLGHSIQCDIVFGNNKGDISTYCSSNYFTLKDQAHPGSQINCIRVTNNLSLDRQTAMIVTAGEEGMIKFWDVNCQIRQRIDVKQAVAIQDLKFVKSYGIQSIDIYGCDRNPNNPQGSIKVLAGMRSGDILECSVEFNEEFTTSDLVLADPSMTDEEKMVKLKKLQMAEAMGLQMERYKVQFYEIFSGHSSLYLSHKQKKITACLHPTYGILASVGDDETLMIWDINRNVNILSKNLGTQATCLDFHPKGTYLAVGLVNGVFLLLDSAMKKVSVGPYLEEYQLPSLDPTMCPKESKSSIINIKFSSGDGDYMAVSYNNETGPHATNTAAGSLTADNPISKMLVKKPQAIDQREEQHPRQPSFVLIYVNKLVAGKVSGNVGGVGLNSQGPFVKLARIQIPLDKYQSDQAIRNVLAVTKFDFSQDLLFLEMCCQIIDRDNNITIDPQDDIFVVWDIEKSCFVFDLDQFGETEWPKWSLSSSINARYINQKFNRGTEDFEKIAYSLEQCTMTNVCRFSRDQNHAIMGSLFGELFAFRYPSLHLDKSKVPGFVCNRVPKRDSAISRASDALTSMVQSINVFDSMEANYAKCFVTGNNDQCILQYKVEYEDKTWELDFNKFMPEIQDPFGEIPHYSVFMSLTTELWNQRKELVEVMSNMDQEEHKDPVCQLELEHVIGRRSYDRRDNVKIDCQGRILYVASSFLVYLQDNLDPNAESFVQQTFLRPQNDKFFTTSPEVSCYALNHNHRLLYIGLNHVEATLIIYEISTNLQLCKMPLPQLSIITSIDVAYDEKHIVIIGVSPEYILSIILVHYPTQHILCQKYVLHSLPFKIKDVHFIPGYTRRFVTCGIQHMCYWKFNGQSMEFTVGELIIPKAFSNIGLGVYQHENSIQGKLGLALVCQEAEVEKSLNPKIGGPDPIDEELEKICVTFLGCCYIGETLITSADDGHLYLWEHCRITKRTQAHQGAILALDALSKQGILASGGMDGMVILWRLVTSVRTGIKSLEKMKEYNLRGDLEPQQAVMNPDVNVQSVCIGQDRVVVGMRSGSIFEMTISDDGLAAARQHQEHQKNNPKAKIRKWMKCIDHQRPISCGVDMLSRRIFTITASGLFTVFDLLNFDVIYTKDFRKISQNIIAFKLSHKVLCLFENDIIVMDANLNGGYDELRDFTLKLNKITDAKLNSSEKILGVASSSSGAPDVCLYEVADKEGFTKIATFYGFKASITYIDFSSDNQYLQVEDNAGEVQLFEIETSRLISNDAMDFELEWLGEGLRSFHPIENVRKQYNGDNKIVQMCKMSGVPIIAVGDEMGTIRFFNYPNNGRDGFYQCYSDHLYTVTKCLFTHDNRFFVSCSEYDRCVFKWAITFNDQKLKSLSQLKMQK